MSEKCTSSCLHHAAAVGDPLLVKTLVKKGSDVNRIYCTCPPIYVATLMHNLNVIQMLLELGANVNATTIELEHTALHCAASRGDLGIVRFLLLNGANADQPDGDGSTAIMLAARGGNIDILRHLIHSGADPNIENNRGVTPLAAAVQTGDASAVEMFIECGARVDTADSQGDTALFHAVKGGLFGVCRLLLEAGARCNNKNAAGTYPLCIAAKYGNSEITRLLIDSGCDVNVLSRSGTALYAAVERQHLNVLRVLIAAGADSSILLPTQRNVLTEALHQYRPSYDIVLELLRAGCDIDSAKCMCHDSPIDIVLAKHSNLVLSLLMQVDARKGVLQQEKMEEIRTFCPKTYAFLQQFSRHSDDVGDLKSTCRKALKRIIGTVHYAQKVELTSLPPSLKKYLLHHDVMPMAEWQKKQDDEVGLECTGGYLPKPNPIKKPSAMQFAPTHRAVALESRRSASHQIYNSLTAKKSEIK